jgi:signal transduction histidine kinase
VRDEALVVEVVNDVPVGVTGVHDEAHGRGILGMRERAELYGGTLRAGPDGDARWHVRAELPLDGGRT